MRESDMSEELRRERAKMSKDISSLAKISLENALKLEAELFSAAADVAVYVDRSTLRERLKAVVAMMKERKEKRSVTPSPGAPLPPMEPVIQQAEVPARPICDDIPFLRSRQEQFVPEPAESDLQGLEDAIVRLLELAQATVGALSSAPDVSPDALERLSTAFSASLHEIHQRFKSESSVLQPISVLGQGDYLGDWEAALIKALEI
jgi:hypothetical protein